MPSSIRVVKADLSGDKRRIPCDSPSFSALIGKLAEAYGYPADQLTARYVDDENDLITVINDADLAMAWEVLGEGKSLLKLTLSVDAGTTPAAAAGATAAEQHGPATGTPAPAGEPAAEPCGLPPTFAAMLSGLAPLVLAQIEKLPENLEALSRHVSEAVDDQTGTQAGTQATAAATATAQAVAAKARALRAQGLSGAGAEATGAATAAAAATAQAVAAKARALRAQGLAGAGAEATVAATEAAAATTETVQQASEAAYAAAAQAMHAAGQAMQGGAAGQAMQDFLPPAYREAVSTAMAMAASEIDQAADFLPPAYREAVAAAMAPPAPAPAAPPPTTDSPTVEDCTLQLAGKLGVEPEAITLESLNLAELRTVANEAESLGQLQVIEAAMNARCHLGIWCDVTGMKPIRGVRYSRKNGNDTYDLCESAWKALPQDEQAAFEAIERPQVAILLRTSRAVVDAEDDATADTTGTTGADDEAVPALAATVSDAGDEQDESSDQLDQQQPDELLVSVSSLHSTSSQDDAAELSVVGGTPVAIAEPAAASPVPTGLVENHDVSPVDAAAGPVEVDPLAAVPEAFRMQVERLLEMGYGPDAARLAALVAAHDGDIRATIMALLD